MTNQKVEDKKQKKYMTSREVAALFGVSLSGSYNRYLTSEIKAWEDASKKN